MGLHAIEINQSSFIQYKMLDGGEDVFAEFPFSKDQY